MQVRLIKSESPALPVGIRGEMATVRYLTESELFMVRWENGVTAFHFKPEFEVVVEEKKA